MNNTEKTTMLNQMKASLIKEIYKQCVESGIDPDTFDYELYASIPDQSAVQNNLVAHCIKLRIIEERLRELQ